MTHHAVFAIALTLLITLSGCDDSNKKPAAPVAPAPVPQKSTLPPATQTSDAEPARPTNTKCLVAGEPIDLTDPKLIIVDYKGKSYGLCCKDCIDRFNKDPEKYVKNN